METVVGEEEESSSSEEENSLSQASVTLPGSYQGVVVNSDIDAEKVVLLSSSEFQWRKPRAKQTFRKPDVSKKMKTLFARETKERRLQELRDEFQKRGAQLVAGNFDKATRVTHKAVKHSEISLRKTQEIMNNYRRIRKNVARLTNAERPKLEN